MSGKKFGILFVILVVINLLFAGYNYYSKNRYAKESENLDFFKVESYSFYNLHEKYRNKKILQKSIKLLKSIDNPTVKNKSNKVYSFEYAKLNSHNANKVLSKLLNSSLQIKKFSMVKNGDKSVKIYFEVRG
jgi:hypothetical protein